MKFALLVFPLYVAGKGGDFEAEAYTNNYLATIFYARQTKAGGVFYTDNIVLTSASTSQLHVRYYRVVRHPRETISFDKVTSYPSTSVLRIAIHPDYIMDKAPRNNIALMKVNVSSTQPTGLFLNRRGLASTADLPTRLLGWAWHKYTNDEALLDYLLPTLHVNTCRRSHYFDISAPAEFCAGFYSKNYEAMFLLPGSPLFIHTKHHSILVGLFSWSESYSVSNFYPPPVFTAIDHYQPWVLGILAMGRKLGYRDAIQLAYHPRLE